MPLERVPSVQKDLVRHARREGVPVIVATQVFDSMRTAPRPTRAEVSDAANAVEDGADAIMLSDETAAGAFPIAAVQILDAVIREAESAPRQEGAAPVLNDPIFSRHGRALCEAAVTLARGGQADAIVAITRGGKTARLLSAFRPSAPVLAATPSETTAARLSLLWGVTPFMCGPEWNGEAWQEDDPAGAIASVGRALVDRGLLAPDAVVVVVRVSADLGDARGNFLHLQRIGAP
jgi:pyruvate kinase